MSLDWWVSDATRRWLLAQARIPERLSPVQVQGRRLLGVSVDDLGVRSVVLVEVEGLMGEEER